MLFAFINMDDDNMRHVREEIRTEHRAYLKKAADRVAFAGPLLSDDGSDITGSLLVLEFPDRAQAQAWIDQEPYTREGLYRSMDLQVFSNLWPQKAGFPNE